MKQTILLIAFGKRYVDTLIENHGLIPSNYNLIVYTNDVDVIKKTLKNADVREYKRNLFRYFDKISLTYKLSVEKKKSILYIDVGRLKEVPNKVWKMDLNKVTDIHYLGNWGNIKSANDLINHESEYFENGYWDNILSVFSTEFDLKLIPTILERIFILPYNKKMKKFIDSFEKLRPMFEHNSLTKSNVYNGIGNGEGLAMGYSILKSNIPLVHLAESNKIKKELI